MTDSPCPVLATILRVLVSPVGIDIAQLVIAATAALATFTVGGFAAYAAWKSHKTGQLALELAERAFDVEESHRKRDEERQAVEARSQFVIALKKLLDLQGKAFLSKDQALEREATNLGNEMNALALSKGRAGELLLLKRAERLRDDFRNLADEGIVEAASDRTGILLVEATRWASNPVSWEQSEVKRLIEEDDRTN